MFIVIAIRDYPDLTSWRGSYFVGKYRTHEQALQFARLEVLFRGGKYGCICFRTDVKDSDQVFGVPSHEIPYQPLKYYPVNGTFKTWCLGKGGEEIELPYFDESPLWPGAIEQKPPSLTN